MENEVKELDLERAEGDDSYMPEELNANF